MNKNVLSLASNDFDEKAALSAALDGHMPAFEALYRKHAGRVHALCLRLCADRQWAEDLTQEAFVRAWQKLHQFRGDSSFGTWLHRLTTNLVISHLRRRRPTLDDINNTPEEHYTPRPDARRDLERCIGCLPDGARAVLVLHSIEGYSHDEIAETLGIAAGTSKAQLHRARHLLQEWLQYEQAH